jgi:acyl-homoserine lactone synthase
MMEAYLGRDEPRFPSLFRDMYRQRYDIYVKRRKWSGLKPEGELEKDQYDTEDAVYLLALDDGDAILGGLRLLPTERPHILGELFPHLARHAGIPRGPDIYELTRFYVAPFGATRAQRDWLIGVLSAGMFEYCLANGIRRVTSVIDTFLLPLMLSMEWPVRPLGLPARYPEGIALAILAEASPTALANVRRTRGIRGPVLRSREVAVPRISREVRTASLSSGGVLT